MVAELLRFEGFELDLSANRLRCAGREVHLERIPFELLCLLIERRGQLVTREEIRERIWGKHFSIDGENAINTAVRKLRRALNDDAQEPRLIITVPSRGYRFDAVTRSARADPEFFPHFDEKHQLNDADGVFRPEPKIAESEVPASGRSVLVRLTRVSERAQKMPGNAPTIAAALSITGLAILAVVFAIIRHISLRQLTTSASIPLEDKAPALPDTPSIAVLPFINLNGDRGLEYFSDGVTEDLIIALSRSPDVLVISPSSALSYKGKSWRPQDVGRELGVQYLVQGGVRRADNQMRLTAHLVEAPTGRELWAANYDRPVTDRFTTQDELIQKIADTLNVRVQLEQTGAGIPDISAMLPHGWGASSSEAYEDFLRGLVYLSSWTKEGNAKAREMEQKAIALDPNYAVAYLVLANTYFSDIVQQWSRDGDLERASEAVHKGLAVADSNLCLSCAYISVSREAMFESQNEQAILYAERAVNLDPNLAYAHLALGEALIYAGRPEEGLAALRKAMRRDPRNRDLYLGDVAAVYLVESRYADAVPILKHCAARFPSYIGFHAGLVVAYTELGQNKEARAEAAEVLRINPKFSVERAVHVLKDQSLDARWRADERDAGLT
jgi:TolB-like protein/DNA-binding winged helix-turn-helix (wHTH) protein/Tfp pilus assembly protein PilF